MSKAGRAVASKFLPEGVVTLAAALIGVAVSGNPMVGALSGVVVGSLLAVLFHVLYWRPLQEERERRLRSSDDLGELQTQHESLSREHETLTREYRSLLDAKPQIDRVEIEYADEGPKRHWFVVLHNAGEVAEFWAAYRATGPSVHEWALNRDLEAVWRHDPRVKCSERGVQIAKGDRAAIRLANIEEGEHGWLVRLITILDGRPENAGGGFHSKAEPDGDKAIKVVLTVFSEPSMANPLYVCLRESKDGVEHVA